MPAAVARPATLSDELDLVLGRLRQNGITDALVVDLSPRKEHGLSAVKVIVPGLDARQAARRAPDFYRRCVETHRLVTELAGGEPPPKWRRADLARVFALPLHRFFKA